MCRLHKPEQAVLFGAAFGPGLTMETFTASYASSLISDHINPNCSIKTISLLSISRQNMKELNTINTLLGGHAITLKHKKTLYKRDKKQPLHICEIGCGGAIIYKQYTNGVLKRILQYSLPESISKKPVLNLQLRNIRNCLPDGWHPIMHLFHSMAQTRYHFQFLFLSSFPGSKNPASPLDAGERRIGFFINDLHRHWMAYYSIRWITAAFLPILPC